MTTLYTYSSPSPDAALRKPTPANRMDDLFKRVVESDDRKAFETIFRGTYRALCQVATRIVIKREVAEEIVDDVFFHFWKNRKNITITASFSAYLFASVRNRSLDGLRKMKRAKNTTLDEIPDMPCAQAIACDTLAYHELRRHMEAAIQSLPAQCRRIFLMSRDENYTYREISEKLGLSIKTVDTQMGRALKHLRSEMKAAGL